MSGHDDSSYDVLKPLAMTCWCSGNSHCSRNDTRIRKRQGGSSDGGINSSGATWANKRKEGEGGLRGAVTIMRAVVCSERGSGWCFDSFQVEGIEDTKERMVPRGWKSHSVDPRFPTS